MALRHRKLLRIIDMLLYYRRMEGMVAVSSTPSRWYWPQPENWHCKYMMKPERYTYLQIQLLRMIPNSHTNIPWAFLFCLCSLPIGPECAPVWCTVERTLVSRSETWREAATCWWPRQEDWWTWWREERLDSTTASKTRPRGPILGWSYEILGVP